MQLGKLFVFRFQSEQNDFGLRAVCILQLISQEISEATGSLTFLTCNLILKTRDSVLQTIEDRGSRLEGLSTYF